MIPDDGRYLASVDGVSLDIAPSREYLLWEYNQSVEDFGMAPAVLVNDNDWASLLELNFGKDGSNDADVAEGDTLKLVVKRRQTDANNGRTDSFTVRVETTRRADRDQMLEDWKTDYSYTPNRLFKDFELELTGSDREVEETLAVTENGLQEPATGSTGPGSCPYRTRRATRSPPPRRPSTGRSGPGSGRPRSTPPTAGTWSARSRSPPTRPASTRAGASPTPSRGRAGKSAPAGAST